MLGPGRWVMFTGAVLVLVGILIKRWAGRYDLKDAAIDSAWTLLRGKRSADNPTAIEGKLQEIASQPTWTGKATRTASTAAGHFLAQIGQTVALILMLAGLVLAAGGYLWR
ncbi:MAG TPA: hypothetical protein VFY92_02080 [Hyphomicrobiaceae bacterium]|nr:hypothetical protein [Hyphomicrobiaceae bacterium]